MTIHMTFPKDDGTELYMRCSMETGMTLMECRNEDASLAWDKMCTSLTEAIRDAVRLDLLDTILHGQEAALMVQMLITGIKPKVKS
jgi:hypothetical protein